MIERISGFVDPAPAGIADHLKPQDSSPDNHRDSEIAAISQPRLATAIKCTSFSALELKIYWLDGRHLCGLLTFLKNAQ